MIDVNFDIPDPWDQVAFISSAAFIGYAIVSFVIRIADWVDGQRRWPWTRD